MARVDTISSQQGEVQLSDNVLKNIEKARIPLKIFKEFYHPEMKDVFNSPQRSVDPKSNQWKTALTFLRKWDGKGFNVKVNTKEEALQFLGQALPDILTLEKEAYTSDYYKVGYEVHPPEPNIGNNDPHIKFNYWVGKSGKQGHIFFEEE